MSGYDSENSEHSMDLLHEGSVACVPGTEPESSYMDSPVGYELNEDLEIDDEITNYPHGHRCNKHIKVSVSKPNNSCVLPFDHRTRHISKLPVNTDKSPDKTKIVETPDTFKTIQEKRDNIKKVMSHMDTYFTNVDKNSRTWTNIHAILCHARDAYMNQQIEHDQLEDADHKIQELEKKLKLWRQIWNHPKKNKKRN